MSLCGQVIGVYVCFERVECVCFAQRKTKIGPNGRAMEKPKTERVRQNKTASNGRAKQRERST